MAKQVIYHGSYCKVENPKIIEEKYTKDFGTGFYCTILQEQAEKWAKKYETPVINEYEYNENSNLTSLKKSKIVCLSLSDFAHPHPHDLIFF